MDSLRPGWQTGFLGPLFHVLAVVAALVLVASAAMAAVLLTYNTSSTASLSLQSPPIEWEQGPDASGNSFVSSWSLSTNRTYYTLTLKPVPEANVTWENLTSLRNQGSSAYGVKITGDSVSGYAKILDYRLEVYEWGTGTAMGALNLRDATPELDLGSVAAGKSYYVKAYVKLDDGTSSSDLPASVSIGLEITT